MTRAHDRQDTLLQRRCTSCTREAKKPMPVAASAASALVVLSRIVRGTRRAK